VSPDELILMELSKAAGSSRSLASAVGWSDRAIRRRLTRLIRDGYVFSPARGSYRITRFGRVVVEAPVRDSSDSDPHVLEMTPRDLLERWRNRR
jgi:predicted transcriptional regulator